MTMWPWILCLLIAILMCNPGEIIKTCTMYMSMLTRCMLWGFFFFLITFMLLQSFWEIYTEGKRIRFFFFCTFQTWYQWWLKTTGRKYDSWTKSWILTTHHILGDDFLKYHCLWTTQIKQTSQMQPWEYTACGFFRLSVCKSKPSSMIPHFQLTVWHPDPRIRKQS